MNGSAGERGGTVSSEGSSQGRDSLLLLNEMQLLLSEKRTALSIMRTGIAVLALPLSVFSVLIATSRYYNAAQVLHFLILVAVISAGLVALASYLIIRAVGRLHSLDRRINDLKREHAGLLA